MTALTLLPSPLSGSLRAPPSKSYTHRGAVIGHLSRAPFELRGPLSSEDTQATLAGLRALGSSIQEQKERWVFEGARPHRGSRTRVVRCASSGTTFRFLLSVAALGPNPVRFEGNSDLARRPVGQLLEALEARGAHAHRPPKGRSLPVTIDGAIRPGLFEVSGAESSQFLSSLLLVAPVLPSSSILRITSPLVSRPYVDATLAALVRQGVQVRVGTNEWEVRSPEGYVRRSFEVTGDASSAAFLWTAAAVGEGAVEVNGIDARWPQADLAILDLLARAGATVRRRHGGIRVESADHLPFQFDFTDCPDLLPLGGVLASFSRRGTSTLRGAAHAALKESDRAAATEALARHLGARTQRTHRGLLVTPGALPRSLRSLPSGDHRIIMASAVAALGLREPSRIRSADAVAKSYPGFWEALRALGAVARP
ncbi:MAG: 3-phosphoshikimate 1-carboxyvinyltransferase [Thermoplasmata archaeon]|nr:3-phosphoshikimate 1-carboxyvinyltransferase [Thermoplasmata archaeon]